MSHFPASVSRNLRPPFGENRGKSSRFGAMRDWSDDDGCSLTDAASRSFVLDAMIEKNEPLHAAIHCPNLLKSLSTAKTARKGRKWRFRRVPTNETKRMRASFTRAISRSSVLDATVEKSILLDTFRWSSRPQSPSTATMNAAHFPLLFRRSKAQTRRKN